MAEHVYELRVCPECGAPTTDYDNDYGWEYACDHKYKLEAEGIWEPLIVRLPHVAGIVTLAVVGHRDELERQRAKHAAITAQREADRKARWDALTPEQQARERKTTENFNRAFEEVYKPAILAELNRGPTWVLANVPATKPKKRTVGSITVPELPWKKEPDA